MDSTEKPLITIAMFKNPPFFRIVKESAQPEDVVLCRVCGKALRSPASRAAGIGPVCAKKEKAKEKKPKTALEAPRQLGLFGEEVVYSERRLSHGK